VELSSRIEYALLALLALSDWRLEGKPLKVSEIAAMQSIPERYLDQILILLRRCEVVRSQRGIKGGYLLAKEPDLITLLEIMAALEANNQPHRGEEIDTLTIEKTATIEVWQQAAQVCQSVLADYTLQDFCKQRENLR
jgi:Rrf2 family protein